MVELAMGLSMASMFAGAMKNTFANSQPLLNNDQLAAPTRYLHAIVGGEQKGPYTVGEIIAMVESGEITPETYMWKPGMPQWKPAKEIGDLGPGINIEPPAAPTVTEP